ncbi:MAG: arylamine N-acetyltransferase [Bacteroidales bacterium]
MDIKYYINRIKYIGGLNPNLETLKALQKSHLLNIPFENLDIHLNNSIELKLDKIYQKIVVNKRGGFCYELNGLFHYLLQSIGFNSKIISARVYDSSNKRFGDEYDHLAIIVKLDQSEYLTDVGFGEFAFNPLKIEPNTIQSDTRGNFIIETHEENYYKVSKIENDIKTIEYIFSLQEREFSEFNQMCIYHQTNENSHFKQKILVSKPTENGRITITGNVLKISQMGAVKVNEEIEDGDFENQLLKWFDIKL